MATKRPMLSDPLTEEEIAWGSRRADAYEREVQKRSDVVRVRREQQLALQKRLVLDGLDERPRKFGDGWSFDQGR